MLMTSWCMMLMIVWLSVSSCAATSSTVLEQHRIQPQRQAESSSSFVLDPGQVHVESHVFDEENNAVLDLSQLTFTAHKSGDDGHEENLLLEVAVVPIPPNVCPVDYQNILECDLMALGISTIVWDEERQVRQLQWCNRQERLALRDDFYPGEYFAVGVSSSSSTTSLETAKVSIPADTPRPVTYVVVVAYCQSSSSSSNKNGGLPSIQVDGSIQYLEQGEKAANDNQKPTDQEETDDDVNKDDPTADDTEPAQQEATTTTPSSLSPFGRFVILCVFGYVLYRFYNYWMGLAGGAGHSYAAPTVGAPFAGRRGYDTVDAFELRAV